MEKIKPLWVKKWVSEKVWSNFSDNNSYCPLRKENGGISMGFMLTEKHLPFAYGISEMTDEEARIMDFYRRARNIRPFPLLEKDLTDIPPQPLEEIIPEEIPF